MEELKSLLNLAETNVGSFFVVALIFVLRFQDHREKRLAQQATQDDQKELALIDVVTKILTGFDDIANRFTDSQVKISAMMDRIAGCLTTHDTNSVHDRKELSAALNAFGANVRINEAKIDAIPDKTADKVVQVMSSELDRLKSEIPPLVAPLVIGGVKSEIDQLRADYEASHRRLMALIDELRIQWSSTISEELKTQTEISKKILAQLEALAVVVPAPPQPGEHADQKPEETKPS